MYLTVSYEVIKVLFLRNKKVDAGKNIDKVRVRKNKNQSGV